jgi:hypothetical protein
MSERKWTLGMLPFEELRRIANERARDCEEERLVEERRQAKLR